MSIQIRKASEWIEKETIKVLIYGEPGIGKTTLSLSAPDTLLIDCDGGLLRVDPKFRKDYISVKNWGEIQEILLIDLSNYASLAIDTVGKLLDFIAAALIANDTKMGTKTGGLTLQGYGAMLATFRKFLFDVSAMGKNLVFVAHDREFTDDAKTKLRPDIQGRSLGNVLREMDLVGYMQSREDERTISFTPSDRFYAKNTCNLPKVINVPDLNGPKTIPILTHIFSQYKALLDTQKEIMLKYNELISKIDLSIDHVTNPQTANEISEELKQYEEIWDSKAYARMKYSEKLKSLNLKFDKEKNEVVDNIEEPKE